MGLIQIIELVAESLARRIKDYTEIRRAVILNQLTQHIGNAINSVGWLTLGISQGGNGMKRSKQK